MELVVVLGEGDLLGCILVLFSPLSFIFGELDVILDVFLPLLTQFRACLEKKEIICLHRLSVPKTISGGNKIKQSKNSMHWKQKPEGAENTLFHGRIMSKALCSCPPSFRSH